MTVTVHSVNCAICGTNVQLANPYITDSTSVESNTDSNGILDLRAFFDHCIRHGYISARRRLSSDLIAMPNNGTLAFLPPAGDSASYQNVIVVCQSCRTNRQCRVCGNLVGYRLYNGVLASNHPNENQDICSNCRRNATVCPLCNDTFYNRPYYVESENGDHMGICGECYHNRFTTCDECGNAFATDGENRCMPCRNRVICRYHASKSRGEYQFFKLDTESNPTYFGFELEVESGRRRNCDDTARDIRDAFPNMTFFESDGSLNNGFEIISQPMSLKYHRESAQWDRMLDILKDSGFSSDNNTCGMHIHISRENLSALTQLKLSFFLYRQEKLCKFVFRRGRGHYCQHKRIESVTDSNATHSDTRYDAISFDNHHTIEIRQPKGTLEYDLFMGMLEFVALTIEFAKNTSVCVINDRIRSYSAFVNFASKNKLRYKYAMRLIDAYSASVGIRY